jgi:alpha-beta hydrolase superfamily lysophospholipase
MKSSTFTFKDQDGVEIFVYKWEPDSAAKAVVQISHGMMEHAARYARFAEALTKAGYNVYANDQRGHGKTAKTPEEKGLMGPNGWNGAVAALKALTDVIKKENPNLPVFLLGHSWGSFMAQNYIQEWGSGLKGAILSGTNGKQAMIGIGSIIAKGEAKKKGYNAPGDKLDALSFNGYNKRVKNPKTKSDWLSRDEKEVEKYVNDPDCGFVCKIGFFVELLTGLKKIWTKEQEAKIPKDLPIYLFAGSDDPVSSYTKGIQALIQRYKKLGIKDLSYKFYEGGRHEMLNETNREEVFKDVISWLDSHL